MLHHRDRHTDMCIIESILTSGRRIMSVILDLVNVIATVVHFHSYKNKSMYFKCTCSEMFTVSIHTAEAVIGTCARINSTVR